MTPLKKLFINLIFLSSKDRKDHAKLTSYQASKKYMELKTSLYRSLKNLLLIGAGIAMATLGLKGFLFPNKFIDGGATGMALLTTELTHLPLPVLLLLINLPFIVLGAGVINKEFAIKAGMAIAALALAVAFFEIPKITDDKLLVAVFGGFCLGAGIGLTIRGGAVIDGTEVLAIWLSKKLGTTIGDIIIIINIIIFSVAAYMLSLETAMYSMITYLSAAKTVDFVIEGIEEYIGVQIISLKQKEIRAMVLDKMGRGVTIYTGAHGYGRSGQMKDIDIVYTVITRLELSRLKAEIERIDKRAFVIMTSIKDTKGGMIKKRPLPH